MATDKPLVSFAHGKESGPWGTKITALADIARRCGYAVDSPDYSHSHDPRARLQQLLEQQPQGLPLVLAGSSMGGYVAAHACAASASSSRLSPPRDAPRMPPPHARASGDAHERPSAPSDSRAKKGDESKLESK